MGRFTQEDPIRDGRNWYSYCDSNPVVRIDKTGQAWETFWDIASLCVSIGEVIANPTDPMNWIGAAGDLVDVLVPCLGGVGETIRAIDAATDIAKVADDVHDAAKTANRLGDAADAVGDAIRASDNVGEAIDAAHDANKTADRFDDISDVAADTKKVTNSNGKKGGEKHQAEIIAEKNRLTSEGYIVNEKEVKIDTPGGKKSYRYPDITATNPKTNETIYVQVGKRNITGTPNTFEGAVKRERDAYDDLIKYGGIKKDQIRFISYNLKD